MIPRLAPLRVRVIVSLAAVGLCALSALAADRTWKNENGGNWSVGENWVEGTPPASDAATTLIFGSPDLASKSYTATNDIGSAAFDLNALRFNGNAGTLVTLNGLDNAVNALNFTGTAPSINMGAGNARISNAIRLAGSTTIGGGAGTLTLGNSVTAPAAGVTLAKSSTGSLVLAGGGSFGTLSVQAGSASATGGTLGLTAPSAARPDDPDPLDPDPNGTSGLQLGTASGQTVSFTASGGAVVNVSENIYVADAAGSTGTLTVTGAGTVLNNTGGTSGRLGVGNYGTGTLNITDGGVVNTQRLFSSRQEGSSSTVLVDGIGSTLHATVQASFGSNGLGTVTVQNGGSVVTDNNFNLGNNEPGNGVFTLTGAGSSVIAFNAGIGAAGTGTMTVKDGAIATFTTHDSPTAINFGLEIATGDDTTGTLNIQSGGVVNVEGDATVQNEGQVAIGIGANAKGTLMIESGGALTVVGALFAGPIEDSQGTVTVTGADSTLTGINMIFGGGATPGGRGDLNVMAGGTVTTEFITFAQNMGSSSTSVVDGGTLGVESQMVVGLEGNGTLAIRNGGVVTVGDTAFLGIVPGVTGGVTVTGAGSNLEVTDQLQLGGAGDTPGGNATLSVSGGGTVSAGGLLILFGLGSVNIENGTVNAGAVQDGANDFNAGTIAIGNGGVLNITGSADGDFSGVISGAGRITKTGTMIQFLSGDNTYQGGTTVEAGTLVLGHPRAVGTGGLTINGAGEAALVNDLGTAVRLSSLTMAGGATPTGKFDVDNNKLIIAGGNLVTVNALVKSGYNGGTWDGTGIMTVASTPTTGLGIAPAEEVGLAGGTFGDVPVAAGDVLIAFTLYGDANLDRQVGFADLVRLAQNYNGTGKYWFQGDFNYDGSVNFLDLVKLAQNYNTSLPSAPIAGAGPGFEADLARAMAAVPEPTTGALLALATLCWSVCGRRSRRDKGRGFLLP
jgi:T5SS/PEP-CTERM-associated repeat protein/autotransporter-associated beta strand protein